MMSMMQQIDHSNADKYTVDVNGMKNMADYIEKNLNVDHEMVMAAMNESSKAAKHNNHWAFAEAVTQRDGRYEWRNDEEREQRKYVEASKVGTNEIFRKSNRLGYGGYDAKGEWKPDASMVQLLVNSLPGLDDTARKNLGNTNAGEHFFMKGDGKYERQLRATIKKTHGDGTEKERQALATLELWKKSTYTKSRGETGLYGAAEEAIANTT
jgi:hypothetical protein